MIVEYTVNLSDTNSPPAATSHKVMTIDFPTTTSHHRAGWIEFGPDGMLYIATGDGYANANSAQTLVNGDGTPNHLGKILRIQINADGSYSIPSDNPTQFQNVSQALDQPSAIWAIGLRNPWRASFGPDGKLYVGDVGHVNAEEINIIEAGKNYGWRAVNAADGPQNSPNYTDPYHWYDRTAGNRAVTGGYFYEGPGPLNGKYIFGDFMIGKIFAMDVSGITPVVEDITDLFRDAQGNPINFGNLCSFGRDGNGNLYAIDYGDGQPTGRLFRLSDTTPVPDDADSIEAGAGNDTIHGGGGSDTIHGGDDNDHIYGDADADHLYGDAGADTLEGGAEGDTYYVDSSDQIVEAANNGHDRVYASGSFTLQAGQSIEELRAANPDSTAALNLTGNAVSQDLIGNAGANRLDGGGGSDTLRGLGGDDTYVVDADDTIVEAADAGIDTVETTLNDYILGNHLENLTLRGTAVKGTGNASNNTLTGNNEANVLNGGHGEDRLAGGLGNDTYLVDNARDVVVEATGQGTDRIVTSVSYALGIGMSIETLEAATGTSAINLTGNTLSNSMVGNAGSNQLYSGTGNDTLDGSSGHDSLVGGAGNDVIGGGDGNDRLIGGTGKDTFTGGKGRDVFVFDDWETGSSKTSADYFTDFKGREGDRLNLRGVDANTKKSGDQNFSFIGTKAFSKAGEVRYEKTKGYTYVHLNTDADKAAEAVIKLKGSISLSKGWFVL